MTKRNQLQKKLLNHKRLNI